MNAVNKAWNMTVYVCLKGKKVESPEAAKVKLELEENLRHQARTASLRVARNNRKSVKYSVDTIPDIRKC